MVDRRWLKMASMDNTQIIFWTFKFFFLESKWNVSRAILDKLFILAWIKFWMNLKQIVIFWTYVHNIHIIFLSWNIFSHTYLFFSLTQTHRLTDKLSSDRLSIYLSTTSLQPGKRTLLQTSSSNFKVRCHRF